MSMQILGSILSDKLRDLTSLLPLPHASVAIPAQVALRGCAIVGASYLSIALLYRGMVGQKNPKVQHEQERSSGHVDAVLASSPVNERPRVDAESIPAHSSSHDMAAIPEDQEFGSPSAGRAIASTHLPVSSSRKKRLSVLRDLYKKVSKLLVVKFEAETGLDVMKELNRILRSCSPSEKDSMDSIAGKFCRFPYPVAGMLAALVVLKSVADVRLLTSTANLESVIALGQETRILTDTRISEALSSVVVSSVASCLVQGSISAVQARVQLRLYVVFLLLSRRLLLIPEHKARYPHEVINADPLNDLLHDMKRLPVRMVESFTLRVKRLADVIVGGVALSRSSGGKGTVLSVTALAVVVSILTRRCDSLLADSTERVDDHAVRKTLLRQNRHSDSIAMWKGGQAESSFLESLIGAFSRNSEVNQTLSSISVSAAGIMERVGVPAFGMALLATGGWSSGGDETDLRAGGVYELPVSPIASLISLKLMVLYCSSLSGILGDLIGKKPPSTETSDGSRDSILSMLKNVRECLLDLPVKLHVESENVRRVTLGRESVGGLSASRGLVSLRNVAAFSQGGVPYFQQLSLEIKPGQLTLVQGSKGSGKTALLRTIAGSWPSVVGEVVTASEPSITYVPTKPYLLSSATLREQISYPQSKSPYDLKGRNDENVNTSNEMAHHLTITELDKWVDPENDSLKNAPEQVQERIMVCRALHQDADVVLFDDSFKHLDPQFASRIIKQLTEEDRKAVVLTTADGRLSSHLKGHISKIIEVTLTGRSPPVHLINTIEGA